MPKVKLILLNERVDEFGDPVLALGMPVSDWEEITDDQLQFLEENRYELLQSMTGLKRGIKSVVLIQDSVPIIERLSSLAQYIDKLKAKQARQRKEEEKHRARRDKEAKEAKLKRARERLEKLKKELGEA